MSAAGPTRHLVLVGLMGAGKTTVGSECAARLVRPFVDTDQVIEGETGRSVREIFEADGESAFRALERTAVRRVAESSTPTVIACGGGVAIDADNRAVLREHGYVVWLDAPVAALAERATRTPGARPLLATGDPVATLEGLAAARHDAYADIAHARVDTSGHSVAEVTDLVLEAFGA